MAAGKIPAAILAGFGGRHSCPQIPGLHLLEPRAPNMGADAAEHSGLSDGSAPQPVPRVVWQAPSLPCYVTTNPCKSKSKSICARLSFALGQRRIARQRVIPLRSARDDIVKPLPVNSAATSSNCP